MYLNKVMIIGNLTRDPEMKAIPNGMKVTNFSCVPSGLKLHNKIDKMLHVSYLITFFADHTWSAHLSLGNTVLDSQSDNGQNTL
jgi:hypothetical protein